MQQRHSRKITSLLLGLILTLGLAACGSGGGNGGGGNALQDEATAQAVGDIVAQSLADSIAVFATGDASVIVPFSTSGISGQQKSGGCEPAVSGTAPDTDNDNDGIELDRTETYTESNCSISTPNGPNIAFTGEFNVSDKDDNDPQSGYTIDTTDGQPFRYLQDGQELFSLATAYDVTVSNGTFTTTYNSTYSTQGGGELDFDFSASFSPTSPERSEGDVSYSGDFGWSYQGESYNLSIDSNNLYYNEQCGVYFERGTVTISDSANNTVTVNFSCDDQTVTTSL